MPQVTMSATEANAIASTVFRRNAGENISRSGCAGPLRTDACQRSDSGTNNRMKNVSKAGAAPTSMTQRHECAVTGNAMAITAMRA